jgi:hypothetical protein
MPSQTWENVEPDALGGQWAIAAKRHVAALLAHLDDLRGEAERSLGSVDIRRARSTPRR